MQNELLESKKYSCQKEVVKSKNTQICQTAHNDQSDQLLFSPHASVSEFQGYVHVGAGAVDVGGVEGFGVEAF